MGAKAEYKISDGDMLNLASFSEKLSTFEELSRIPIVKQEYLLHLDNVAFRLVPEITAQVGQVSHSGLSCRIFDPSPSSFTSCCKRRQPELPLPAYTTGKRARTR